MLCETCQWRREGYTGVRDQRLELNLSIPCLDPTCEGYKPLPPEAKRSARRQLAHAARQRERAALRIMVPDLHRRP